MSADSLRKAPRFIEEHVLADSLFRRSEQSASAIPPFGPYRSPKKRS